MIPCPCCHREMRSLIESGVEIDVCDNCSAIWLDPGELNDVAKSADNAVTDVIVNETGSSPPLTCPRCSGSDFCDLEVLTLHQTIRIGIARCGGCGGVFVDNENLDRLRGQVIPPQHQAGRGAMEEHAGEVAGSDEPGIVAQAAVEVVGNGVMELLIQVICSIG